ncbi:pilus assembly PilX family protein [Herbaspirillum robiniae]|nr:PilX N-terminal domain-containing pilus assembly protein [Herbaspirillum robiniae]
MRMAPLRQRGATLVISLVMLAVILLLGTAAASLLVLDERAARNHRAHQQARLAAQAALDDACEEIRLGARIDDAAFPREEGCRTDAEGRGLCTGKPTHAGWRAAQLAGAEPGSAAYGDFTGARPPGNGAAAPRYLIERVPGGRETLYRASAIGFGPNAAVARMQGVAVRRGDEAGSARCVWLSWRALSTH